MKKTFTLIFTLLLSVSQLYAVEHIVNVTNNAFSPSTLSIATGDVVRWVLVAGVHTVTSDNNAWTEGMLDTSGDEFTHTFNTTGAFPYHCRFHPGMDGTITVTGTSAAPDVKSPVELVKVFPNPVLNILSVTSSQTGEYQINITNMLGQVVLSATRNLASAENPMLFNVGYLPAGSYLFTLQNKEGILEKKRFNKAE